MAHPLSRGSLGWLIALVLCLAAAPASAPSDPSGHWEGTIALPGKPLDVRIDLANKSGTWTGTIDIPQQNASGLKLDPVTIKGTFLIFTIHGVPGDPTFNGTLDAGKITGSFTQGPLTLPFSLGRDKLVAVVPKRPQEQQAATTRYSEKDVTVSNGTITLAGTLTLPDGPGPFPAALLIPGSGPQNRDEEIFGHHPFKVIADRLSRAGIATLRMDKRGCGASTGAAVDQSTTADFASDALSCVAFLKTQTAIDPKRIGLIGHSEGGIVAPLAASQSKDVAFVVILAGSGVPGDQVLVKQSELIAIASGTDAPVAKKHADELAELIKTVESNADPATVKAKVRELAHHQNDAKPPPLQASSQQIDAIADAQSASLTTPWFRYFLTYDPRTALKKVTVPTLALCGELDRQVSADQNLPEIESALQQAGNTDITIRRLPGLNHLFQTAHTGSPEEYSTIEETFNDGAIDVVKDWIVKRFGKPTTQPSTSGTH